MRLLKFVLLISLLPTYSFAQRGGGGGHGGGGGGSHGGGGGGFHGSSMGGGGGFRGGYGGGYGGSRGYGGYGRYGYGGYGYGLGFGLGLGWPYWGYGYGYPGWGDYGYDYPYADYGSAYGYPAAGYGSSYPQDGYPSGYGSAPPQSLFASGDHQSEHWIGSVERIARLLSPGRLLPARVQRSHHPSGNFLLRRGRHAALHDSRRGAENSAAFLLGCALQRSAESRPAHPVPASTAAATSLGARQALID